MSELCAYGLTRRHSPDFCLAPASLTLHSGLVHVLVGPNGAGKSTLLRLLSGLDKADSGQLQIDGSDVDRLTPIQRAQRIGYLPQRTQLAWPIAVADMVALGRHAHGDRDVARQPELRYRVEQALSAVGALHLIDRLYTLLPGLAGFRVVILHILFNLMLIVVFSWRVDALARFMERFFITTDKPVSEIGPRYIPSAGEDCADAAAFPVLALTREILRILGTIQNMLEAALDMLIVGKHERAEDILRMEEKVNTLFKAVRAYAVALTRKGLNETEQRRVTALLRYTANLENAGDVICKTMLRIPESMKKSGKQFSDEGKTELERLFRFLIGTTQLSAEVIMAWHPDTANLLVQRKRDMKAMCHDSSRQHIGRLSQGHSDAMSSSSAHLDLISDLRWISTQISSIGYDVLPESDSPGRTEEEKLATNPE